MPSIRCCEHPAGPFHFPAYSEKQFLGILKFINHVDAHFSFLWMLRCRLLISLNFRETISGLRKLKNQYRCPDFTAVNTPWNLFPYKVSVTEKCYPTGVQIIKMWQGLLPREFLSTNIVRWAAVLSWADRLSNQQCSVSCNFVLGGHFKRIS